MATSTRPSRYWVGGATTWTDRPTPGLRLLSVRADGTTRLGVPEPCGGNPTSGALLPSGNLLVVHELTDGQISLYSTGGDQAILLNSAATHSADPTSVAVTQDGGHAFVANYSGGALTVHRLTPLCVKDPLLKVQYEGNGPTERQRSPHPHQAVIDWEMGSVLVPDLGTDVVHVHLLEDLVNGVPNHRDIALTPGCGPRHIALTGLPEDGLGQDTMLVACELDNTIRAIDIATGDELAVAKPTTAAESLPSAIHVTSTGLVLVGNRGPDTIGILQWDEENGTLTYLGEETCGGKHPRDLALTEDQKHVVVANLKSDNVTILALDPATATLQLVGSIETCSPTALIPVERR